MDPTASTAKIRVLLLHSGYPKRGFIDTEVDI